MNEDSAPKWITKEEALYIHETTIERHGGLSGIRDNGLLESALARPENFYAYGERDTFILAASYADGIARNHPFADGNKRTSYGAAGLFLHENGYDLGVKDVKKQIKFFEDFAAGNVSREEMANFYRDNSRERDGYSRTEVAAPDKKPERILTPNQQFLLDKYRTKSEQDDKEPDREQNIKRDKGDRER